MAVAAASTYQISLLFHPTLYRVYSVMSVCCVTTISYAARSTILIFKKKIHLIIDKSDRAMSARGFVTGKCLIFHRSLKGSDFVFYQVLFEDEGCHRQHNRFLPIFQVTSADELFT